jgi:bacterial/archaeal transporter family protein
MWVLFALLSGFGAAVLAIVVKLHLKHFNPFFVTFIFALITITMFLVIDLLTDSIQCSTITCLSRKEWGYLILAGLLNSFAFACYLAALKYGNVGGAVAIDRLSIVFVVFLSIIFLQESFSLHACIGALMMMIGVILLNT